MIETLSDIAIRMGTDKYGHGYCPYYARHLGELRDSPIRLLEIGILNGASLKMWQEYLTQASVTGVDIDPSRLYRDTRIQSILGDIKTVPLDGTFDIIIDDGSHHASDIVATHARLWPLVNAGGWYIIEDWQVQWNFPEYESNEGGSVATELMHTLMHMLLAEIDCDIDEIHVYRQILFIRKKP